MTDILLHRLHAGESALLEQVADGVFDDPVVPALMAAYLADPGNLTVLALADGLVVARVAAAIHRHVDKPADLYIDELNVAERYRRQGIARRLVAEVTRWATELGCADCWLAAEAGNVTAQALYASLGTAKPCVLYYWSLGEG